jgi:hypothetical protein
MNKEYNLNQDQISVKTSTVVRLNEYFTLMTLEGPVDFKVEINADFADIPEKYHEVVLNMFHSFAGEGLVFVDLICVDIGKKIEEYIYYFL